MLVPRTSDILTKPQSARWERIKAFCDGMPGGEDPMVFHGTSALRAVSIIKRGFDPTFICTPPGAPMDGVHWGPVARASWAAEQKMEADDPPAILYARLSSVLASGAPYPDLMYGDDLEIPFSDWRDSLDRGRSVCIAGGRHVPGLKYATVMGLPLHPRARDVRLERDGSGLEVPGFLAIDRDTVFAEDADVDLDGCWIYQGETPCSMVAIR